MKKTILIILAFVLLLNASNSYADTELKFCSIPWLTDENNVLRILNEEGYIFTQDMTRLPAGRSVYLVKNEVVNYQPLCLNGFQDVVVSFSLADSVKGRIAGCPIEDIILSFAREEQFKLISIKLVLANTNYADLKNKLEIVYGQSECSKIEEEGIESNLWKGDNNTGILLYTESGELHFDLIYGRLDAIDILNNCLTNDPNDVSGL